MTMGLKVLDGVALTLTGVGLIGGALAAIDVLPAPMGVVCAAALGLGVVACAIVRVLAPVVPEHVGSWFDDASAAGFHPDPLRIKTPISDPLDSAVAGTITWQTQQDAVAKPYQ